MAKSKKSKLEGSSSSIENLEGSDVSITPDIHVFSAFPDKERKPEIEKEEPLMVQETFQEPSEAPEEKVIMKDLERLHATVPEANISHTPAFQVGDDVEVIGLHECLQYMMIGKITKILPNHSYAVHGMSYLKNKKAIGHNGVLVRTFKEVNLRKVTLNWQQNGK